MDIVTVRRKVYVERSFASNALGIYFVEQDSRGRNFASLDANGFPDWHNCRRVSNNEYVQDLKPALFIPMEMANELVLEISNLGFPTENESTLKGKIQATEKHLEDMRQIAFEFIAEKQRRQDGYRQSDSEGN